MKQFIKRMKMPYDQATTRRYVIYTEFGDNDLYVDLLINQFDFYDHKFESNFEE